MRWFLLFILQFHCLLASTKASPLGNSPVEDSVIANLTQNLFPRVRVGGGSAQSPKTTAELFLLNDGPGSCNGQTTVIDNWLKEIYLLHDAVEQTYADLDGRTAALLWYSFFGVPPRGTDSDLYRAIGGHISRVSQFLAGGGLVKPAKTGEMPRLFCSGEAGEYQNWDQPAKDQNSEPIVSSEDPLEYLILADVFPIWSQSFTGVAFWFESFKGYFLDNKDEDDLCAMFPDDGKRRYAVTAKPFSEYLLPENSQYARFGQANRHILLCPTAFSASQGSHSYPSLAQAVSAGEYPVYGQNDPSKALDKFLTFSATLYHELYHLTDENNTNDGGPTLEEIRANTVNTGPGGTATRADNARRLQNAHNPQSYVYLAMAAYMVQNPPQGKEPILYLGPGFVRDSDPWAR
ncbi:hypothetical protein F4823DRAFT_620357 [Ustulina deusta]|nr:hypothetical protein F4823DRAFT_620357 [Ustulina deusta]